MNNNRREFIKKTSALAALSLAGIGGSGSENVNNEVSNVYSAKSSLQRKKTAYTQDAGIKMCFAYFGGIEAEKRKVEFGKQLNVLGAVGGINHRMAGLNNVNAWEFEAVDAVKKAWEKVGLKLEVIEGPPALSEKTKQLVDAFHNFYI